MFAPRARTRHTAVALAVAIMATGVAAPSAGADHHLMRITEVSAGVSGFATSPYVELQMYAPGQEFVGGHQIKVYDASGAVKHTFNFPADVANGQSQRHILVAGSAAVTSGDFLTDYDNTVNFSRAGGAVCYISATLGGIDCVSWGTFSAPGMLPSPPGTPAPAMPANGSSSLTRSIARRCPHLLEAADDTNDSAADFTLATPTPLRNNSPITELPCPNTNLDTRPADKSRDRTPTWTFSATQGGSTFECKIDSKAFAPCTAPKTFTVGAGAHTFRVRAVNANGKDPSPATDNFTVLKKKKKRKKH